MDSLEDIVVCDLSLADRIENSGIRGDVCGRRLELLVHGLVQIHKHLPGSYDLDVSLAICVVPLHYPPKFSLILLGDVGAAIRLKDASFAWVSEPVVNSHNSSVAHLSNGYQLKYYCLAAHTLY